MERKRVAASRLSVGPKSLAALALSLVLGVMLALPAVVHAGGRLPDEVPDLLDPGIRARWDGYALWNLEGDPDFPVVVYLNKSGNGPAAVMMVIDARNGTSGRSLASDPIIAIALFGDSQTLTRLYYDQGFAKDGRPSGQYAKIAGANAAALSALSRWAAHLQRRVYM
jgi:hypothetical protein